MVMEQCTWVLLCSGDLKAWMVKVNTGSDFQWGLLGAAEGVPRLLITILILNPLPLPSLFAIYSPSQIPLHRLFANFVSQ